MPIKLSVLNADVTEAVADVLVLKFAHMLWGADRKVVRRFEWSDSLKIEKGAHCFRR